jgi:hypothetical protein
VKYSQSANTGMARPWRAGTFKDKLDELVRAHRDRETFLIRIANAVSLEMATAYGDAIVLDAVEQRIERFDAFVSDEHERLLTYSSLNDAL